MASWSEVEREVPELAAAVRASLDAHLHKVVATLRRDGAPRVSGCEATFWDGGLWPGMMPDSMKAKDLLRDPRCAIHSAPCDDEMKDGDAKVAGRAVEVTDDAKLAAYVARFSDEHGHEPPEPFHLFRVEIDAVVHLSLAGDPPDRMVVASWRAGVGERRVERT